MSRDFHTNHGATYHFSRDIRSAAAAVVRTCGRQGPGDASEAMSRNQRMPRAVPT